jgi:uncharacterized protein
LEFPQPDEDPAAPPARDEARAEATAEARAPRVDPLVFARKQESLRGRLPLGSMQRLLAAGIEPEGGLDWDIEGSVARDETRRQREFLRVRTVFSPWMTCSRCLEPVQLRDLATDTLFRLAASEEQAEREDREAESFEVIAATPSLDLGAIVEDEAILALPMAPVHDQCEWQTPPGSLPTTDV